MASRFAVLRPYILSFPLFIGGVVLYQVSKRQLNARFPDVPLESLPESSFVRRLVEESRQAGLSRWSDKDDRQLWAPYYDAYQATVPRRVLETYRAGLSSPLSKPPTLSSIFTHAFLNCGPLRLERLATRTKPDEREDSALFEPNQEVIRGFMRVFESDLPSSSSASSYETSLLPPSTTPSSQSSPGISSTILFWRMPPSVVHQFDTLASWGYPWRMMVGRWHELLVEDIPDEGPEPMVRLTLSSVHVYDTLGKDDRKVVPKWVQRFHGVFAKACLASTLRRLER